MATVRKDSSPPLERPQVKTEGVKKEKIEGDKKFPVKRLKNSKKTRPESVKPEVKPITEYFPVRRSGRKTRSTIEKEKFERLATKLKEKDEEGLKVVHIEGKGRGVVSTRHFIKDELVCEYSGELISYEEAKNREEEYGKDTSIGCYMYYFKYKTKKLCVDATKDNNRLGRLLNHSRANPNVYTKLYDIDDQPYLCLLAAREIETGEELEYDYGERKKDIMEAHQWLKNS